MLTPTPTSVSMASGRGVCRDPGARRAPTRTLPGALGGFASPEPLPVPELPSGAIQPGAGPPRMLVAFPSPRTMCSAAEPPIGTERRIPAARAPPAPSPLIPPLLRPGLAGRCRPSRCPPYPGAARQSGAEGSAPAQEATPAESRPATPCAAAAGGGRREEGSGRRLRAAGAEEEDAGPAPPLPPALAAHGRARTNKGAGPGVRILLVAGPWRLPKWGERVGRERGGSSCPKTRNNPKITFCSLEPPPPCPRYWGRGSGKEELSWHTWI